MAPLFCFRPPYTVFCPMCEFPCKSVCYNLFEDIQKAKFHFDHTGRTSCCASFLYDDKLKQLLLEHTDGLYKYSFEEPTPPSPFEVGYFYSRPRQISEFQPGVFPKGYRRLRHI